MKNIRFVSLIVLISLLSFSGCASLPPEVLISQKKVSKGIEISRNNQILLINNFAEEAKLKLQLEYQLIIPTSLDDSYGKKDSYSKQEITESLIDYGNQLQIDHKKIDDKRNNLIQETNKFFNDLLILSNMNLELLESSVKLNKKYKIIFDDLISKNDDGIKKILEEK